MSEGPRPISMCEKESHPLFHATERDSEYGIQMRDSTLKQRPHLLSFSESLKVRTNCSAPLLDREKKGALRLVGITFNF